jgi:hypothetical protein
MSQLPAKFSDLQPYIAWALDSETARNTKRMESSYEEIERFYAAMVARAEVVISHLDQIGLDNLRGDDLTLLNMLLSLAEVTPAVAYYGEPKVRGGFDSNRMVPREI